MGIVLVTGGAGNLGRQVVFELAQEGHVVRVLDLPELDYSFADTHTNIHVFPGDMCDQSDAVQAAYGVDWAVHLAQQHGSRVVLLHAYHLPVEFQQLEGAYLPPDFWTNVKAEAEETLERYAAELRQKGVPVESVVADGYAATAIIDEVAEKNVGLIVNPLDSPDALEQVEGPAGASQ